MSFCLKTENNLSKACESRFFVVILRPKINNVLDSLQL